MQRLALLVAAALACTPAAPTEGGKAGGAEPATNDCATRVAAIRTLLAQLDASPLVINTAPLGVRPPESSRGVPVEDGIPVFLKADGGFIFNTHPLPTLAAVKGALDVEFDSAKQFAELTGRPFSARILLAADRGAPASAIRDLAAVLPPEVRLVLIVDLAGDAIPTPPLIPDAVRDAVNVPAMDRSRRLAAVIEGAIGTCTALLDVFNRVATTTADRRSEVLYKGVPDAIEACKCEGLDVDTVVAAVWSMGAKTEADKRQLALPLSRDPAVEAVAAPATVADLARLLETRGERPFRLAP